MLSSYIPKLLFKLPILPTETIYKKICKNLLSTADIEINGHREWDPQVYDSRFFERLLNEGSLGLGESYMEGWWQVKSLDKFICRILKYNLPEKVGQHWTSIFLELSSSLLNLQSRGKSQQVAKQHYDIGNELYQKMLDSRMIYSCAYWKNTSSLEEAQKEKLDLICKKLYLKPGMTLLDIGCGWGGVAKFAAEHYGVSVVGITISKEQYKYAKQYCKGLPVEVRLQDYRDLQQKFDRIVSIGMFEHVGYKNYRDFMSKVRNCLNPNGLFLLHTIGSNTSVTCTDEWIHKYIFPNSMLPSLKQITESIENLFIIEDLHNFGADYDKTLMAWHHNFSKNWESIKHLYNETFYRMWTYYLLACAGSFRARRNQLWQITLSHKGVKGGYVSIR